MATKGKLVHQQAFCSTLIAGMHALCMGATPGRTACCDALGLDSTALQLIILICHRDREGLRHAQKHSHKKHLAETVRYRMHAGPALMQAHGDFRTSPRCSDLLNYASCMLCMISAGHAVQL